MTLAVAQPVGTALGCAGFSLIVWWACGVRKAVDGLEPHPPAWLAGIGLLLLSGGVWLAV